jgi:anthraniloyl-CoA monooxygenase
VKVACIGGGPAGLFLAILLKKTHRDWHVAVYEQNPRGNTFGWGIVFSDGTMENLQAADAHVAEETRASLAHWDDIEVHFRDRVLHSSGHGFIGVGRHRFLEILGARARSLGVRVYYKHRVEDLEALGADLIVGSDGVNSAVRAALADRFEPTVERGQNRFTWLGTHRLFPAFTFLFEETEYGWFQAHCYRFEEATSTFIVECREETWRAAGLDRMSKAESIAFCQTLFAEHLDGHELLDNSPHLHGSEMWISFPKITNERWHTRLPEAGTPVVLLGDAAATAHFSIGSGTKLAVESAIALADKLAGWSGEDPGAVLDAYEEERRVEVLRLQSAARNSTEWFETVELRGHLAAEQFAYSLLTRSQRVSHENLRLRDPDWLRHYERWLAERLTDGAVADAAPPMFLPFTARGVTLANRVAVSPMAMYSAEDGVVQDFHFVHFGARALGGAGLLFTEMTCVTPDGRITPGCAGLWNDEQAAAWRRIVDFVHAHTPAKFALQLGHAGPKGSTRRPWEAGGEDTVPLDEGWELIAPSAAPYAPSMPTPRAMSRADMDRVRDAFVAAARRGDAAGFDWLELHCAHGYLLSAFISPLTNRRDDTYGGTLENRLRYPLEVFDAVRAVWPEERPMSVRISATDWVEGGTDIEDAVEIAAAFRDHGADLIDVSTGQVSVEQKPVYGRMFQTPYAERIRLETHAATMAVGNIYEPDHVNSIIASGRADLCLLARPHLSDPQWTLRAAADLGYTAQWWPPQYLAGKRQFERLMERQKEMERQGEANA